jgi:DNA-binding MarR family transcriptional regulator
LNIDEPDKRMSFYEDCLQRPDLNFPNFDADTSRVILNLLFTSDAIDTYLSRSLAQHGLSRSAYNLLMILRMSDPTGRPLHEIGELLLTSRANVTGLVDCLEAKGLVQRVADKTDRRSRLAVLTPDGGSLLDTVTPQHRDRMCDVVDTFSDHEKRQLTELLVRLRENVARRSTDGSLRPDEPICG